MVRGLFIDPGAERCGWAVLETGPTYVASGLLYFPREKEDFQPYRLALEAITWERAGVLLDEYEPTILVNETIPAVGGGNFVVATQSYLANVACTTIHAAAIDVGVPVAQISARTVQTAMAGKKKQGQKITKPQVRNGVIALLPELKPRIKDWVKVFDECDAIGIGLAYLGYSV